MENKTGCIYVIDCFDTEDFYIGSTVNFKERKYKHKSNCSNEKSDRYNFKVYQTIREYGGWENWAMFPIEEEIPVEQLKEREQFYIDTLEPSMNSYDAIMDKELRIQRTRERASNHYILNREEINKLRNEKIECECGDYYTLRHKSRHRKTKKHIKQMENKLSVKVI